jgi:hypothetical protein
VSHHLQPFQRLAEGFVKRTPADGRVVGHSMQQDQGWSRIGGARRVQRHGDSSGVLERISDDLAARFAGVFGRLLSNGTCGRLQKLAGRERPDHEISPLPRATVLPLTGGAWRRAESPLIERPGGVSSRIAERRSLPDGCRNPRPYGPETRCRSAWQDPAPILNLIQ